MNNAPRTNLGTRVFLVLLRLAIGWHFFFEGWEKLSSYSTPAAPGLEAVSLDPTPLSPARRNRWWSSEPYVLEAKGPLAGLFRGMTGDSIIDRVDGQNEDTDDAQKNDGAIPQTVIDDWNGYFDYFAAFYELSEQQREDAENRLRQRKEQFRRWLFKDRKDGKTTQDLIQEYKKQIAEARRIEQEDTPIIGPDEVKRKLGGADGPKTKASQLRRQLGKELFDQYREMKNTLIVVLTPDQLKDADGGKKEAAEPMPPSLMYWYWSWLSDSDRKSVKYFEQEPYRPGIGDWSRLDWMNFITRYGIFLVGVCLLLGLLTRTACVAGASFLLLFFLAMPPLPGLIESPKAEGHYFIINKNIIEMLALLMLATTRSGRWLGLDGLLQFLRPPRFRKHSVDKVKKKDEPRGGSPLQMMPK